jgi:hypothetical protein
MEGNSKTANPRPSWRPSSASNPATPMPALAPTRPCSAGWALSCSPPASPSIPSRFAPRYAPSARREAERAGKRFRRTADFRPRLPRVGLGHPNQRGTDDRAAHAGAHSPLAGLWQREERKRAYRGHGEDRRNTGLRNTKPKRPRFKNPGPDRSPSRQALPMSARRTA